jgi:hypothetical protein
MPDVDYQQPEWQTPAGNEGAVLAGIIARSKQQSMEKARLGMEQQQFQAQAKAAADKSMAATEAANFLSVPGRTPEDLWKQHPDIAVRMGQPIPKAIAPPQFGTMGGSTSPGLPDLGNGIPNPMSQGQSTPGQPYVLYNGKVSFPKQAAAQRPMNVPGVGLVNSTTGDVIRAVPPKTVPQWSDSTDTTPAGDTIFGQRRSDNNEFHAFNSLGQQGGTVMEKVARAAEAKKKSQEIAAAKSQLVILGKERENQLAQRARQAKIQAAHPDWPATKVRDQAYDDINSEMDELEARVAGGEDAPVPTLSLPFDKVPPATQRKPGMTTTTPKGTFKWNGAGWIKAEDASE